MALSTYFETPTLRAIDEEAANINQPLSSTLEAQLASSHEWLHRNAGGAVAMIKSPAAATATGYNNSFHTSAVWASMLMTPFLVTRGLTSVKVSFYGTIEAFNTNVRLELQGFGQVDATWTIGGTATTNVYRTITLTLDQPSEYEYETDLILWGKSQLTTSTLATINLASYTEGKAEVKSATLSTNPNRTVVAAGLKWESTGFRIDVVRESLFRTPTGETAGGSTGVFIAHEKIGGVENVGEAEISRITSRAFFIETRSA
jgi:hypothetical protein